MPRKFLKKFVFPRRLRKRHWLAAAVALSSSHAFAAKRPEPVILTVDGKHYVSYTGVSFDPVDHLVLAPDIGMKNCTPLPSDTNGPGTFDLVYTDAGDFVEVKAFSMRFFPTQIVMATAGGNLVCDGQALGYQTGFDRIFRGEFETDE